MLEYQQKQKIFRKIYTTYIVIQHNVYAKSPINVGISTKTKDFQENIHNVYSNTTQRVYKKSYKR